MSATSDYFTAKDDPEALTLVESNDLGETVWGGILMPGLELAQLEAILSGRSVDEVIVNADWGRFIGSGMDESGVVAVTLSLQELLVSSSPDDLRSACPEWSETDELNGRLDVSILEDFVTNFAALAKKAQRNSSRLYCLFSA